MNKRWSLIDFCSIMRKSTLYISVVFIHFFYSIGLAQTLPEVSKPGLELRDDKLVISYSIRSSSADDKYTIKLEITDQDGNIINAQTLSGDIGDNVSGGNNKEITWDFKKDNFSTDTEIYVQVSAEVKTQPPPVAIKDIPPEEPIQEEASSSGEVKTAEIVLWSTLCPGLGFVKMEKSPWHLAKGVAGYGCIASAIIFNRLAVSNYNKYLDSYEIENSDNYYNKSVQQDKLSEVFAYSAIGIWAAEIIWVLIETKGQKSIHSAQGSRISIEPGYDLNSNTSMICFSYNF